MCSQVVRKPESALIRLFFLRVDLWKEVKPQRCLIPGEEEVERTSFSFCVWFKLLKVFTRKYSKVLLTAASNEKGIFRYSSASEPTNLRSVTLFQGAICCSRKYSGLSFHCLTINMCVLIYWVEFAHMFWKIAWSKNLKPWHFNLQLYSWIWLYCVVCWGPLVDSCKAWTGMIKVSFSLWEE